MKRRYILAGCRPVEIAIRQDVDLVEHDDGALLEYQRIFHRLVIALRDREHDAFIRLADCELSRADEVADILDDEQIEMVEVELLKPELAPKEA